VQSGQVVVDVQDVKSLSGVRMPTGLEQAVELIGDAVVARALKCEEDIWSLTELTYSMLMIAPVTRGIWSETSEHLPDEKGETVDVHLLGVRARAHDLRGHVSHGACLPSE
jgi:hypothetical protein